jgi:Glyoxalase-like domain
VGCRLWAVPETKDEWMATPWTRTFDSWEDWLGDRGVPEDAWDDGAYLRDPSGVGPRLSLLAVPEPKTAKNRVHLDIQVMADPEGNEFCVL